jgi:hypothetical protein
VSLQIFESNGEAKRIPEERRFNQRKNMKPKIETRFPITDYNYHSVTLEGYNKNCARISASSFRSISSDYFKNEARQSFAGEALFFAAIVLTSVPAFLSGASALAHFVRAIGAI